MTAAILIALPFAIPPAVKTLAVIGTVYGLLQAAKKIPAFTAYLKGWVAIAFNVALTVLGLVITIPADQLYTSNTAILLLTTALGAAGVHGTVANLSSPQVLGNIPPDPQVKELPAILVPLNPKAVPLDPPKP